ncbi:MAG: ABC transporter ATP-binding protein, partial [Pseudomonadota bacterium]
VNLAPAFGHRYPHEFSGGQRQRISIARALALDPKVIICDEAVSALDVTIKAQVINLLMDLQSELGLSYLFISHDMAVVERISHRVAVMYLGQVVEIGPRENVFENPTHSYTRKLLSAVPVADPRSRRSDRTLATDEVPSATRPLNYVPDLVEYREVDDGHYVAIE